MDALRREKEAENAELDKTMDDTITLISQSFFQAVRPTHICCMMALFLMVRLT